MRFAQRMEHLRPSGIRELFDRARDLPDCIDLSIGQAHFDVPRPVREAAARHAREARGGYGVTQGQPELVEETTRHLREHHGLGESEAVLITSGATGAIALAMLALAGPGDEVLLPDPYFVIYRSLVSVVGATPVFYDLHPDFRLRIEELEERVSERTRLIVLNSPANPTGAVLTAAELEAVAALCRDRDIPVLSDELYDLFVYDAPHVGIKRFPECPSLLVGGFSKSHAMAGWRLGWAAGDPELIDRMRTLQQFVYACPPTIVQAGALAAFGCDLGERVEAYRRNRDVLHAGLTDAGYEVTRPAGSFFAYPRVPWGDDLAFCERALAEGLVLVPGRSFSRRSTHVRVSFAAPRETVERGVEVLLRIATPG